MWTAALLSIAAHALIATLGAVAVARGLSTSSPPGESGGFPAPKPEDSIVIDLPAASDMAEVATVDAVKPEAPKAPPRELAAGTKVARPDEGIAGKGGDTTVAAKARNLAPRADYDETVVSQLADADKEQENRLLTAGHRKTRVDRRYVVQPMELTFVSSGKGFRYERHPVARADASIGVASPHPSLAGGVLGSAMIDGFGDHHNVVAGSPVLGSSSPAKAAGTSYGTSVGSAEILGASVTKARPHVDANKSADVSGNDKGKPDDDKDANLAVKELSKSFVSLSTPGAAAVSDGKGGTGGGGAAGAGGTSGEGSKSVAFGDGTGNAASPRDERRTRYTLDLNRRLASLVRSSFPKEEEIELRSGTVIVDITIGKLGNDIEVAVFRQSGIKIFDTNVVTAIRSAGSLEPVPDLLSSGAITVRIPVSGGWHLQ